jgi:hypothetical protein
MHLAIFKGMTSDRSSERRYLTLHKSRCTDRCNCMAVIVTLLTQSSVAVVSFLASQAQSHLQSFSRQRFMTGELAA